MPARRFPRHAEGFNGKMVYLWKTGFTTTVDADLALDEDEVFCFYKCGLIFINITAIVGTWTLQMVTSLRLGQTAGHKHILNNQLQVVGRTATGQVEVGWNCYSGANTLLADKMELRLDNTAGASPSITINADVIFYN